MPTPQQILGLSDQPTPVAPVGLIPIEDVWRRNSTWTLYPSAARTATPTIAPTPENKYCRGVRIGIDITAIANTADTFQIVLQESMASGAAGAGRWVNLAAFTATAFSTITAPKARLYTYHPNAGSSVTDHEIVQGVLGRLWRVQVVHVGTGSITYSVDATLLI